MGIICELIPADIRLPGYESIPLLVDNISDEPITHKDEIVSYLNGCECNFASSAISRDVFTGEAIGPGGSRYDEEYEWGNCLAHYVDKYNLKLPDEFVSHILQKRGIGE